MNTAGAINSCLLQGILTLVTKIDSKIRFPDFLKNSAVFESKSHRYIAGYQFLLFLSEFLLTFFSIFVDINGILSLRIIYLTSSGLTVLSAVVIMFYFKERKVKGSVQFLSQIFR